LGLSRNKVAVPEGAAGTPPFWSRPDERAMRKYPHRFAAWLFGFRSRMIGDKHCSGINPQERLSASSTRVS